MVTGFEWLSATRLTGLMAYSASLLACAIHGRRFRKGNTSGHPFLLLAGVQLALLLDMAFDWRWKLHAFWMQEAIDKGVYGERRGPQLLALEVLSVATAVVAAWMVFRLRSRMGLAVAATGTLLAAGLWCCECISYHFVDRWLYQSIGPVMAVALLWVALAAITCLGVWLDRAG